MPIVPPAPSDPVVEHAVDRLAIEFSGAVPLPQVRTFVVQARTELSADPPAALPELVERLARTRIQEVLERAGSPDRGREISERFRRTRPHRRTRAIAR